jgi:uncharacterized membrane protein YcaP (DUF421 family)
MNLNMFIPDVSILEKIVRPLVVYFVLLIAFRVVGKRELGQMTPFDLIVLLTISNVLQNAMIDPDTDLPLIKRALLEQDGTVTIITSQPKKSSP